jgi:hypothetical protein
MAGVDLTALVGLPGARKALHAGAPQLQRQSATNRKAMGAHFPRHCGQA